MTTLLKIGTRGSPLALVQTEMLIAALRRRHPELQEPGAIEVVKIVTSGDKSQAQNLLLADQGGKALFAKEIEEALLAEEIDCAVHSMKDMPPALPEGLEISCLLPREDPRDAFFSTQAETLDALPPGAVVGTCSPRRQAIILARRPDLKIAVLRGNVDTRLKKLAAGEVDATILAVAGLKRLGQAHLIKSIIEPEVMLPAASQGAIGVEVHQKNGRVKNFLEAAHCTVTQLRVTAERAFLEVIDGSCKTPLAALMSEPDPQQRVRFDVWAARPDGSDVKKATYVMTVTNIAEARQLGLHAGKEIKDKLPPGYLYD